MYMLSKKHYFVFIGESKLTTVKRKNIKKKLRSLLDDFNKSFYAYTFITRSLSEKVICSQFSLLQVLWPVKLNQIVKLHDASYFPPF